ncbi:MAG TPA: DUF4279 domain-containing protein [Desulfobulbus sp.]|nr:DUF4279 domain-containing protein [Desulfobulbus sp.]
MWRLEASDYKPENLDAQIAEILNKTTQTISVWQKISKKYHIDLFCGLFMVVGNEGMDISPSSLKALGDRGIHLSLDIYGEVGKSPKPNDLCPCNSGKIYRECCYK